jgi:hypothetical protein
MAVGTARVIDTHVNPLAKIAVEATGDTIAIDYGRPGKVRVVKEVDLESLWSVGSEPADPPKDTTGDAEPCARVVLDDGSFIRLWKAGSPEWGYRVFARQFDENGRPQGAAEAISPPDVGVIGSPRAITTDGRHVVATFVGSVDDRFVLMAVGIEPTSDEGSRNRVAHK